MDQTLTIARLDGLDPSWRTADGSCTGITPILLCDARTGSSPLQSTVVQFFEADGMLWARFECEATTIRATMRRYKDKVWTEGAVEVYLQPAPDGPLYEFQLSPIGTCRDLRVHDPGGSAQAYDDSWSCEGLQTQAWIRRDDRDRIRGWGGVFGIPLANVGSCSDRDNAQAWKIGAFRLEYDPEEFSALRAHPSDDAHSSTFLRPIRLEPAGTSC
ncbi:MAG: carbohydrate-binding family 9-like protein [Microbacterium sp.]